MSGWDDLAKVAGLSDWWIWRQRQDLIDFLRREDSLRTNLGIEPDPYTCVACSSRGPMRSHYRDSAIGKRHAGRQPIPLPRRVSA